jgi:hypothetical protein
MRPASGINAAAAVMKTHGDSRAVTPRTQEIGAATSSALRGELRMVRSIRAASRR